MERYQRGAIGFTVAANAEALATVAYAVDGSSPTKTVTAGLLTVAYAGLARRMERLGRIQNNVAQEPFLPSK